MIEQNCFYAAGSPTMSGTQKLEEVKSWLESVFNGNRHEFDLEDDETVEELHLLSMHSRSRRHDLKLLMDYQRHQMMKYERESERMIQELESVGISECKRLSDDVFAYAQILAHVAHKLGSDRPTKADLDLKLTEKRTEAVQIPLKRLIIARQTERERLKTLASLSAVYKTEISFEFQKIEGQKDQQETDKLRQKTSFILEKQKEYCRLIERFAAILQRNGYRDKIACKDILAKKAELDRIKEEELTPLKQKLDAFKGLPADFELAQAKLAEAEDKFNKLNDQMMRKIAAMQL